MLNLDNSDWLLDSSLSLSFSLSLSLFLFLSQSPPPTYVPIPTSLTTYLSQAIYLPILIFCSFISQLIAADPGAGFGLLNIF